jgi:hypothetical protein
MYKGFAFRENSLKSNTGISMEEATSCFWIIPKISEDLSAVRQMQIYAILYGHACAAHRESRNVSGNTSTKS